MPRIPDSLIRVPYLPLRSAGLHAFVSMIVICVGVACATPALAQSSGAHRIDAGDTAWMVVSTALVMLMTPGLALFYGGMVRSKNVLNMLMQSFIALGIVTIVWILWGYSLAFSRGNGFIGGLQWIGLRGIGAEPNADYAATIPHQVFMLYQMMFAIITPALISGAIAERMKFSTYVVFVVLWSTFVYCPLAHWVWGKGGWLGADGLGALDFAGGTVVHISSGISALVVACVLGRRRTQHAGHEEELRPHNLPMTLTGTAILWFGWFGFNAGSGLSAAGASAPFLATHAAAAAAGLTWSLIEWTAYKKPTALGFATGAVAGLVAITPAAGYVGPLAALVIGAAVSFISFYAIKLKHRFHFDDTLDVFGVHGVGGAFGAIATGLFCETVVNDHAVRGLFFGGGFAQLGRQLAATVAAIGYAAIVTLGLILILKRVMGLRVAASEEDAGLDLTQHGESGYSGMEAESPMLHRGD